MGNIDRMGRNLRFLLLFALAFLTRMPDADAEPSMAEVLAASAPSDWRLLDPNNTLYLDLPAGRVIIELAPRFAPLHVQNIKALARAQYYNGPSVLRVQENYVAQWGDPDNRHPIPAGAGKLAPEFDAPLPPHMGFTRLADGDEVGFSDGFPAARSAMQHLTWLTHCYGMVGVGRDIDVEGSLIALGHPHSNRQFARFLEAQRQGKIAAGGQRMS
jgi:peptidylprolyl isomerase